MAQFNGILSRVQQTTACHQEERDRCLGVECSVKPTRKLWWCGSLASRVIVLIVCIDGMALILRSKPSRTATWREDRVHAVSLLLDWGCLKHQALPPARAVVMHGGAL